MARMKKAATPILPLDLEQLRVLQEENEELRGKLAKARGKRLRPTDGFVTFWSPWPKHQEVLRPGTYRALGANHTILEGPVLAMFDNQVATFSPKDTYLDFEGKSKSKVDRMRELYADCVARRKRPQFVEVTEETDLKIQGFRERIPPSALIEFKGPLVDLPPIPPPPKEAQETLDTLERRRPAYGR